MSNTPVVVQAVPDPRFVRHPDGQVRRPPEGWVHVPPGDAALTRRLKAGPCWVVQAKKGRKIFSRGLWAPSDSVSRVQDALKVERANPAHARKKAADAKRRERAQADYVAQFEAEVLRFLGFAPRYEVLAQRMAKAITTHATPVGSGTVARTARLDLDQKVEAAVIAWMRHQTTAYDQMVIPRVKGMRREVRQRLARTSRHLLNRYRQGETVDASACPLARALGAPVST